MRLPVDAKETPVHKNLLFSRNENFNDGAWREEGSEPTTFFQCQTPRVVRLLLTIDWQKMNSVFFPLSQSNGRESLFSMEFRAENYSFVTDLSPSRIVNT